MNVVALNSRQVKLLEVLLQAKRPLSLQMAADKGRLNVCTKTVRSDFDRIQMYSKKFNVIMALHNGIITVSASEEDLGRLIQTTLALHQNANIAYTDDRAMYIALDCLLQAKIPSLDVWSDRFNVSRPCIQNDIKKVRLWLSESQLSLKSRKGKGFYLEGEEFLIRKALVRWLVELFGNSISDMFSRRQDQSFYQDVLCTRIVGSTDIFLLMQIIYDSLSSTDSQIRRPQCTTFALYLALMLHRSSQGFSLDSATVPSEEPTPGAVIKIMTAVEESFHVLLPKAELYGLQQIYKEAGFSFSESIAKGMHLAGNGADIVDDILQLVELLGIPCGSDIQFKAELSALVTSIINYPERTGLNREDAIKFGNMYPAEFALCQRLIFAARQTLGIEIPLARAEEVGLFIAARAEEFIFSQKKKKNVLLVVPESNNAAQMIYWQLTNRFASLFESITMAEPQDIMVRPIPKNIDCVISTVPFNLLGNHNITIPAVLAEGDMERLRRQVVQDFRAEVMTSNTDALCATCLYDEKSRTAEELFRRIGAMLEQKEFAMTGYTEGILHHEMTYGSGIETPVPIAVPHTDAEYTKRQALACVVTKYPLEFRMIGSDGIINTNISLFPLLEQKNAASGIPFYKMMTQLRSKKLATALKNCRSTEEITRFVNNSIKLW